MAGLEHLNKPGFHSVGSPWKMVLIEDVDTAHGIAMCIDNWGKHMPVPLRVRRAKGPLPRAGELWMIDQSVGGRWTFAQIVTENLEQIVGYVPRDFTSAFNTMANQGLLQDQTVAVDSYPWLVEVDPVWKVPSTQVGSGWLTIATLGGVLCRTTAFSGQYITWPTVLGTGHWTVEVYGYIDGVTYTTLNGIQATIGPAGGVTGPLAGDAVHFGSIHCASVSLTVTRPGKNDLLLVTVGPTALTHARLTKVTQL